MNVTSANIFNLETFACFLACLFVCLFGRVKSFIALIRHRQSTHLINEKKKEGENNKITVILNVEYTL